MNSALVPQLTQSISQLSLKPGDEEIKKKGWWQFWKLEGCEGWLCATIKIRLPGKSTIYYTVKEAVKV